MSLIRTLDKLPKTVIGKHLKCQPTRTGTSPVLNYAEACDAESRKDFIHKIKTVLKELRETQAGLKIIEGLGFSTVDPPSSIEECNELLSIFKRSYFTAKKNIEDDLLRRKEGKMENRSANTE